MKVDFALSHHEAVEQAWWEANPHGTEAQFEAFLLTNEEVEASQWDAAMAQMKRAEAEFDYGYFA